jgi:hypothetical protein
MAATQAQLDEAEAAYHSLCIGKGMVEFRDSNGELVRYNVASLPRLAQYIQQLKIELGVSTCNGPMRPLFQ